ncbi:DUF106 domain-containing protein [Candidatus Woesearchaeota archaeon]|nr:DUF106 domain-containing protein [Candidatus Woesearchaeota archaeon]
MVVSPIIEFFSNIFNPILDPVFGILLKLPPFWGIFFITLIVTLITTLIYKKMTDQEVLRTIKEDMKQIRKDMNEFKHDTSKLADLQKRSLEKSMIQMKETMKPMLITMLPILIIFGWFSTHLAYYPIMPEDQFSVNLTFKDITGTVDILVPNEIDVIGEKTQEIRDNKAGFFLKGEEGDYTLSFNFENKTYTKDVLITKERKYKDPEKYVNENLVTIKTSNAPIKVLGLSWFWTYLVLAIVLNSLLRKVLKIH